MSDDATPTEATEQPATWRDKNDRSWTIDLDYGLCQRIKKEAGIDLPGAKDGRAWMELGQSIEKLVQVLWICCEEQAEHAGVSEEDFARGLGGQAIDDAAAALERAWILFYPAAHRRLAEAILAQFHMAKGVEQERALETLSGPKAREAFDKIMSRAQAQVERELDKVGRTDPVLIAKGTRSGPSGTVLSGTPDSTPPPSPASSRGDTRSDS